jgi:peptide/nickel transport system ATP-binding protein
MIFQEPMVCLSPVHTIGNQIIESIQLHKQKTGKGEARDMAIHLLGEVGIPYPQRVLKNYAFELSGGMRQRAMIAVALASGPRLLIADEPTTAIDVTIQAKFLNLLRELQQERSMSILFITHDLGVIAEICETVAVMYVGKIVEKGPVENIYYRPKHPYTELLFKSIPPLKKETRKKILATIRGNVPDPFSVPEGCSFCDRCPRFMKGTCDRSAPPLFEVETDHIVRCFLYADGK